MNRGYFVGPRPRRAFMVATVFFPSLRSARLDVHFLIDTGADRTVLSPTVAGDLGVTPADLAIGPSLGGVGGRIATRVVDAALLMGTILLPLVLTIPMSGQVGRSIPSILGRDVLSRFTLFMEERTDRVLLLAPDEADRINWA